MKERLLTSRFIAIITILAVSTGIYANTLFNGFVYDAFKFYKMNG